jgi:uncharacterized protein (TIGR02453 family)
MIATSNFNGFSEETVKFLRGLKANNSKSWFASHRKIYERHLLTPAMTFVAEMGQKLEQISPNIVAVPKIDQSIFRIYRDVRFSSDKSPYKTHLAMLFWEGERKKIENPSFYIHFDSEVVFIGAGIYGFPRDMLRPYREAVVHPLHGKALRDAINRVRKNPENILGWKHFKKIPAGFDPDHPNADLLRYNGLGFQWEAPLPEEFYSGEFVDFVFNKFKEMSPIHHWLVDLASRI